MPFTNVTIKAVFKDTLTKININSIEHATVSTTPDSKRVQSGTEMTLSVTPESGYGSSNIKIYKKDDHTVEVEPTSATITDGIVQRVFTVPDYDIDIVINVAKTIPLGINNSIIVGYNTETASNTLNDPPVSSAVQTKLNNSALLRIVDNNGSALSSSGGIATTRVKDFVLGAPITVTFNELYKDFKITNLCIRNDTTTNSTVLYSFPEDLYKRTGSSITFTTNLPDTIATSDIYRLSYQLYQPVTISIPSAEGIVFEETTITAYPYDEITIQGTIIGGRKLTSATVIGNNKYIEGVKYTPDGTITFTVPNIKDITLNVTTNTISNYAVKVIKKGSNDEHNTYGYDVVDGKCMLDTSDSYTSSDSATSAANSTVKVILSSDSTLAWEPDSLKVVSASTGDTILIDNNGNQYMFRMPADNVIVYATYSFSPIKLDAPVISGVTTSSDTQTINATCGTNNANGTTHYPCTLTYNCSTEKYPVYPTLATSDGEQFLTSDGKAFVLQPRSVDDMEFVHYDFTVNRSENNLTANVTNLNYAPYTYPIDMSVTPTKITRLEYYTNSDTTTYNFVKS